MASSIVRFYFVWIHNSSSPRAQKCLRLSFVITWEQLKCAIKCHCVLFVTKKQWVGNRIRWHTIFYCWINRLSYTFPLRNVWWYQYVLGKFVYRVIPERIVQKKRIWEMAFKNEKWRTNMYQLIPTNPVSFKVELSWTPNLLRFSGVNLMFPL